MVQRLRQLSKTILMVNHRLDLVRVDKAHQIFQRAAMANRNALHRNLFKQERCGRARHIKTIQHPDQRNPARHRHRAQGLGQIAAADGIKHVIDPTLPVNSSAASAQSI